MAAWESPHDQPAPDSIGHRRGTRPQPGQRLSPGGRHRAPAPRLPAIRRCCWRESSSPACWRGLSWPGHLRCDRVGIPGGTLYGLTSDGGSCKEPRGASGCGIAFKLTPPQPGSTHWLFSRIYVFKGSSDGLYPVGKLTFDASGAAYGVTQLGGPCGYAVFPCGYGTVFRLTPPGPGQYFWNKTILHTFTGGADGEIPASDVTFDATGALVGITNSGGTPTADHPGLVYRLAPSATAAASWTFTVLHSFPDSATFGRAVGEPFAGVVSDSAGNLYGITDFSASDNGQVFRLRRPPASGRRGPTARFIRSRPTRSPGSTPPAAAWSWTVRARCTGAVFSLAPPAAGQTAWTFTIAHAFNGINGMTPNDLAVLDNSGSIYGATDGRYEPGQAFHYWEAWCSGSTRRRPGRPPGARPCSIGRRPRTASTLSGEP